MLKKKDLLIWWLNDSLCEDVFESELYDKLPEYITNQTDSLYGRSHTLKLFIAPELGRVSFLWPLTDLAFKLSSEKHCGIVFRKRDLHLLQKMPGIITDHKINLVENDDNIESGEEDYHIRISESDEIPKMILEINKGLEQYKLQLQCQGIDSSFETFHYRVSEIE